MMRSPNFHPDNVEKEDEGIEQQETKDCKSIYIKYGIF